MTTMASSSLSTSKRQTFACVRCAERKVKCDRARPCSACVRHNVDCVFNPVQPTRKRHKRVKVNVLTDRLKHYEALLQERGIDPGKLPNAPVVEPYGRAHIEPDQPELQLRTPSSIEPEPTHYGSSTRTTNGPAPFKFVENSLWSRVVQESHDPEDTLEDSSDLSDEELDNDRGFVFGYRSRPRHPPPERIHQLWEIFVYNVDPLTKTIHVGTLWPAIQKAADNPDAIPKALEALMFAIYGCAVMSLGSDTCEQRLGEPRDRLLHRYISATEAALSRAKFMGSVSLVVLQALVLHLIMVRDIYTPRTNWTLTGMAVRIAQVMGLERDGIYLGLSPFETEMRRRVWWQLKLHDWRTAELCGLAKFRDMNPTPESTRWPTNVNDDQLFPEMSAPPVESERLTDIAFLAARCEMTKFAASRVAMFRQQGKDISRMNLDKLGNNKEERRSFIKGLEERVETGYLRYCDPSQPLHLVIMLVVRYGLNVVHFLTNHPRGWGSIEQTSPEERQMVWEVSLRLLEQHNMVQTNPFIRQFAWNAPYFRQWHAFIHVLDVLQAEPLRADAEKAWRLVGETYDNTPDMITNMKKPIHAAVGNLCMKGYTERENALRARGKYTQPTPNFILRLRQRREAAKARRKARATKNNRPQDAGSHMNVNHDLSQDMTTIHPEYSMEQMQELTINPPSQAQPELEPEPANVQDPFDFFSTFEDERSFGDMEIDDLDLLLAQDYDIGSSVTEPMDWRQWDAWLAHPN
jgi:hypothetical protein